MDAQCTIKDDAYAEAGQLFKSFDDWRQREGLRKITQTKFGKLFGQLGFKKSRNNANGRIVYQGIGINQ